MFKNWTTKKTIWTIVIILIIIGAGYYFGWFGDKFKYTTTRMFRSGGNVEGGSVSTPRPIHVNPTNPTSPLVNTAYHRCDKADTLLAGHGVHGECIGSDGRTVKY